MYRLHRGIMASGDGLEAAVRSFGPAAWYQPGVGVTGTLTASNWADQSGNGRDLAQATSGNQPIYLPYSGTPYAWLPGVVGNYFSTPDSVAASITGAITIDVYVSCNDWTPSAYTSFIGKWEPAVTANESYALGVNTNGTILLSLRNSNQDLSSISSTAAPSTSSGDALWIRASVTVGGSKEVTFYTSSDGATWTQLGNVVSAVNATNILNSTYSLIVGGTSGSADNLAGRVFRVRIFNSALGSGSGSAVVDFSPSTFTETSTNGATATASTGEVWTLNSAGAKPAQVVKSAMLLADGTDDWMETAAFDLNQPSTVYLVAKGITYDVLSAMTDGLALNTRKVAQYTASPLIIQYASGAVDANDIDMSLGAFHIVTAVFSGDDSSLTVDSTTVENENPGTANASGITLFSAGDTALYFWNGAIKEAIFFPAAHTAAERSVVRNYLAVKHGIAL